MKAKLFGWTLLFLLMLPITPLFGQAQETNHPADKSNSVQSSAVPVDEATAQFEATKVKAETGDAQAQYNLADCYASGRGVAKDNVEALKWYRKAADGNNAEAQLTLALAAPMASAWHRIMSRLTSGLPSLPRKVNHWLESLEITLPLL